MAQLPTQEEIPDEDYLEIMLTMLQGCNHELEELAHSLHELNDYLAGKAQQV